MDDEGDTEAGAEEKGEAHAVKAGRSHWEAEETSAWSMAWISGRYC